MVRAVVGGFSLTELNATRRNHGLDGFRCRIGIEGNLHDVLPLPPLVVPMSTPP